MNYIYYESHSFFDPILLQTETQANATYDSDSRQASGAYIFRPGRETTTQAKLYATPPHKADIYIGKLVTEVRMVMDNVISHIRKRVSKLTPF
jgi:hypothetical protein